MGASRAGGKPGGRAAREKNAEWAIREERKGRVGAEGRCRAEAQRGSSEGWARREERLRVEVTRGQTQGGAAARKIGSVGAPRGKTQGGAAARKLGRERGTYKNLSQNVISIVSFGYLGKNQGNYLY